MPKALKLLTSMKITSLIFALILSLGLRAQFGSINGSSIDSGEVIGSFMYLFTSNDTIIVDLSSIAVESDSFWSISSGKYEPIYNLPISFEYDKYNFGNDTIPFVAGVYDMPYSGSYLDVKEGKFINGLLDMSPFFGPEGEILSYMGYIWPPTPNEENYVMIDTSQFISHIVERIQIGVNAQPPYSDTETFKSSIGLTEGSVNIGLKNPTYNKDLKFNLYDGSDTLIGFGVYMASFDPTKSIDEHYFMLDSTTTEMGAAWGVDNSAFTKNSIQIDTNQIKFSINNPVAASTATVIITKLNENGLVLPSLASEPTGENGAIFYSTTDSLLKVYNTSWGYLISSDLTEYANDAAADADTALPSGYFYKLTGDRAIYQKP